MADMNVSVSATIQGLVDGMGAATDAVKKATESMQNAFNSLGGAVGKLMAPLAALGAVVGGGKLFADAVKYAADWNMESLKLAKTLGVSTQEASRLKVALHGLGIDTQTYTQAATFMSRQVLAGGEGLSRLGIQIKDAATGNLRPMNVLMTEAIEKLNGLTAGVDRNAAGISVFGRGWQESSKLLLLTKERMAEAAKEAEELHLIVGPEGAKKAFEYQEQMRKLHLISESLQVQVGNALLPILTQLGAWMGESGPQKASLLAGAIKAVLSAFLMMKEVVAVVAQAIAGAFDIVIGSVKTVAEVFIHFLKGEYKEALNAFHQGGKEVEASWDAAAAGIREEVTKTAQDIDKLWAEPAKTKEMPVDAAKGHFEPKDSGAQVRQWKGELEQIKALQENWFTWTAQREMEFWAGKKALVKQGTDAYRFALTEENKARKEVLKEQLQIEQANLKSRETSEINSIALREMAIKDAAKRGEMTTADETAALIDVERQRLAVKLAAINEQLRMEGLSALERQRLRNEQVALEEETQKKITELQQQEGQKRAQLMETWLAPMKSAATGLFDDLVKGQMNLAKTIDKLWKDVAKAVIGTFVEMGVKYIASKLASLFMTKTAAAGEISAQAGVAGAGAAAAMAAVPLVGPALAAAAMADTSALVLATMMPLAVAARGYDIPRGVNPLVQAHEQEMILPADIAGPLRSAAKDGSLSGGSTGPVLQIFTMDSRSFEDTINRNDSSLLRTLRRLMRDGRL